MYIGSSKTSRNNQAVVTIVTIVILSFTFFHPRVMAGYQQNMLQRAHLGALQHGSLGTLGREEFGTL